jgi:hypothetical protein
MHEKYGFNETISFLIDQKGHINAFSFNVIDYKYLASLEKNPKKKRILSTKVFDVLTTRAEITPTFEGARPIFTKVKYDSIGMEVKDKQGSVGEPEEEQSFLRKYWLYILLAFLILPNLLSTDSGPEGGAAGGPGPAAARK